MIRRVLRTELLRGTAPPAALACAVGLSWTLLVHPDGWSGRWMLLAAYLRTSLLILCPLMVAAGAWQGGRDRRRQVDELLGTTARPAWQPVAVAGAAVALAGTVGVLLPFAVAAVLVGRVATYAGGGWWWTLGVGLLALWPATALGLLAGRLIPLRVVAPIAGLLTYLGLAIPEYFARTAFTPVIDGAGEADAWPPGYHAWQAGWLLTLAAVLVLLAVRRWAAALVPVAVAGVLVVVAPGSHPARPDAGAAAPVCTTAGPQVCVSRVNAFLLADTARIAQPILARVAGIPGAPSRAVDVAARTADRADTVPLYLNAQSAVGGRLLDPGGLRADFSGLAYRGDCPVVDDDRVTRTQLIAAAWLGDARPGGGDELARLPLDRQRAWFAAYLAAQRRCDTDALRALADPR